MGFLASKVEIELIIHATESIDKIIDALYRIIDLKDAPVVIEVLQGHYGNPIYRVMIVLKEELADEFARRLCQSLVNKDYLKSTIGLRFDSKNSILFLRLDKQELVKGKIAIYDGDDVIRVKMRIPLDKGLDGFIRECLGEEPLR